VLITGHTGFKGSWLTLWLQNLGAQVTGFANGVPTTPSLYEMATVGEGIASVRGDIRDGAKLAGEVDRVGPEIVVHLAAQSTVLGGYAAPVETYEVNVMGTINLIEALRRSGRVRAALVVTTDKCYRPVMTKHAYREDDALGGSDPYSASKACAEIVAASYRSSFLGTSAQGRVALATARAGNVVGGGDWTENRIVPDLIRAFQAGETARIRNPDHVRPWQHVLDPLAGYLQLLERLFTDGDTHADAWNFGPPDSHCVSVAELADRVASLWGDGARWETVTGTARLESSDLRLDSGKARTHLNWSSRLALDESLRWTVEWYRSVATGVSARAVTTEQINRYVG
jgi:CDP-glucose 4,6-dehydratase